jgi:hypothetical protein
VPGPPAARPAAPRAPSQAAFALGVAKEVSKEILPRNAIWMLLLGMVLGALLYRVLLG